MILRISKFLLLLMATVAFAGSTQAGILTFTAKGVKKPQPCGLVGSIEQRIRDCESIDSKDAPSTRRFKNGSTWNLVTRSRSGKELLYNAQLQLVWTDTSGYGVEDVELINYAESVSACQDPNKAKDIKMGLSLDFRLPSVAEAKAGINEQLKDAFESNLYKGENNAENNHGSLLPSDTGYTFFTDELLTTKEGKVYALEYGASKVSKSVERVDYYTFKTIGGNVYRGYEAKNFLRCVATVSNEGLSENPVSENEIAESTRPHPNNSVFTIKTSSAEIEGSKIEIADHHPIPDVDQPCVEFRVRGFFKETQYKRYLEAQPLLDMGFKPMRIDFGYDYIRSQFCSRDDSMLPIYQADGVTSPSMPLYVSPDGNQISGFDYKNNKAITVWTKLGTADNGETILLHHPTNLIVGELQAKVMDFKAGSEAAKTYQMSFVNSQGLRTTLKAGQAMIPSGTQWSQFARDGLPQLRPPASWNRDSVFTFNKSGTFLSRAWIQGNGQPIATDGDIYFSAFVGSPKGNISGPYGYVDTLFTVIDSTAERKVLYVVPAEALNQ